MVIDKNKYTKKRSVLSKQSVKKKPTQHDRSLFWDLARFVTSVSLKVSIVIIAMVSVSLMFVYLYKYIITSPYIELNDIQITGVDDGIKRELIKLAGLNNHPSLLAISPVDIKAKMERHPWVKSVELEKRFPHTLIVKAEKQSPRALVAFDTLYYMNKWGRVFKELDKNDDMDYPIITGVSKGQDNLEEKLILAAGILDAYASETGLWSLDDISEIHVNEGGDALIYSVSLPFAIRVGGGDLGEEKNKVKELVGYLKNAGAIDTVNVIDMNYHDGAVVSFKKPDSVNPSENQKDIPIGL
jgi:cell division protein FtsQ